MIQLKVYQVVLLSIVIRIGLLIFGLCQDAFSAVKYTDIDYIVFSDAARYVYNGQSPYERETYRYTPILAWLLVPNCFGGIWYHFGKCLFVVCDVVTGLIILELLKGFAGFSKNKALALSSIWLLNPMVMTISTRGSSESVLTVMVMFAAYYLLKRRYTISAIWLGLSIHFKIYPIIYLPAILLFLSGRRPFVNFLLLNLVNRTNLQYVFTVAGALLLLNGAMYSIFGYEYLFNAYIYHLVRLDHRHNFSLYNVLLYYKSASLTPTAWYTKVFLSHLETFAFVPQFLVSSILIPICFAKSHLLSCFFIQTFAFVTFNKVLTSQYFIWFLIFLPFFLASSPGYGSVSTKSILSLAAWVVSQASWLYFAYELEFLGISTFDTGLLFSSCAFFLVNCLLVSLFIEDLVHAKT